MDKAIKCNTHYLHSVTSFFAILETGTSSAQRKLASKEVAGELMKVFVGRLASENMVDANVLITDFPAQSSEVALRAIETVVSAATQDLAEE